MVLFDIMVRFGALSLLICLALLAGQALTRVRRGRLQAGLLLACCISLCGPLVIAIPDPFTPGPLVLGAAKLVASPNTVLLFLFGLSVFTDAFKLRAWHVGLLALVTSTSFVSRLSLSGDWIILDQWLTGGLTIFSVMMALYLLGVIIHGSADDLVRSRRLVRLFAILAAVLTSMISIGSEWVLAEATKNTLQAGITLLFAGTFVSWLARLEPTKLVFEMVAAAQDLRDNPQYLQLIARIDADKIYLEPGLTVTDLARRIGLPAHVIRRLITDGAGVRNFSAFINARRIEHAKLWLRDRDQVHIPVLTIALESGFGSIASFNRAFREQVGQTPTAFRREALADLER